MENGIDITGALTKLFYCRRPQAYLLRLDDNLTAVEMTRSMESQSRREKKHWDMQVERKETFITWRHR